MRRFRPVWQAQLKAEGTVVRRGHMIGYVECTITDEENDGSRKRRPRVWRFGARRPKDGNPLTLSPAFFDVANSAQRTGLSV